MFTKRLYDRYNVCPCERPAVRDKDQVDLTLADLRKCILRAEVAAEGDTQLVFTEMRRRIDMTRRALAAHIPREPRPNTKVMDEQCAAGDDRDVISGIRQRALRHRRLVLNSLESIHHSYKLLRDPTRQGEAFTA